MVDLNGDGKFDSRGEMFDSVKPFNVKGTTWKLADMTAGGTFKIVKSEEAVAEIQPPPDHSVGKKITPFKATRTDGTTVNFPADYKGKVVMLDFWATWCGPCMMEVPGLVKGYNEFHPKGLEILGISLDQANAGEKVKSVTADKGMTWPQVYDGKYWKAEVADLYGINSIPAAFLVDGDTGEVLAAGNSLRGESLEATVKGALEKKGEKK
jgi:thiol-disulfide isomerase/thioredoxin